MWSAMPPSCLQTNAAGRPLHFVSVKCSIGKLPATSVFATLAFKVHQREHFGQKFWTQWWNWREKLWNQMALHTPCHSQQWSKVIYGDRPWSWRPSCKVQNCLWTRWHAVPLAEHTRLATFGKNAWPSCENMEARFAWMLWCRMKLWMRTRSRQIGRWRSTHVQQCALLALSKTGSRFVQWWAAVKQETAGDGWLAFCSIWLTPRCTLIRPAALLQQRVLFWNVLNAPEISELRQAWFVWNA